MAKIMIVTYNKIPGIPVGRHENGNVVMYSGVYYCLAEYTDISFGGTDQNERVKLKKNFVADVHNIGEAYIYVGNRRGDEAKELICSLLKDGKKVHMVACSCDEEAKWQFARKLSIPLIESDCNGCLTCDRLFRELA